MKRILLLIILGLISSCNSEITETEKLKGTEFFVNEYLSDFIEDAGQFGVNLNHVDLNFYLSDVDHVECSGNNAYISSNSWLSINEALLDEKRILDHPELKQFKKAMIYKAISMCQLDKRKSTLMNHYSNTVPVPNSLTYFSGVSSSLLVNFCYNDSGHGIYSSIEECPNRYYRHSFWEAYLEELFTGSNVYLLEMASDFDSFVKSQI